jgi:hypothetical protein
MIHPPLTKKEAQAHRYTQWGGNPKGNDYNPACCAYSICGSERGALPCQCSRKNGHGPDGLYCKQHSRVVVDSSARSIAWLRSKQKLTADEKKDLQKLEKIVEVKES